jgi:hypothetical protein
VTLADRAEENALAHKRKMVDGSSRHGQTDSRS